MAADATYPQRVIDYFDQPRNAGHFEPADDVISATAGRIEQGAVFRLSAQVADDALKAVRFEAYGCPHCIAAASWLTQRLTGCPVDELGRLSWREVAQALSVPPEKHGRLLLLEDSVRRLAEAARVRS